jgi:hypothetical protein
MRGRVNGTELPISILVDPIIHRPADLQTWAQKLEVFFRQFNVPQHSQYISRVMKTRSQRSTRTNKSVIIGVTTVAAFVAGGIAPRDRTQRLNI